MQTLEDLGTRLNLRRQWLQLGLLSASVVTPLLARWNDLRAAERARALAEEAESRLKGVGGLAPWTRRQAQQQLAELAAKTNGKALSRHKVSAGLWLTGAAIGLVAAGAGAYVLVRRRMSALTEEQLLYDLAPASLNGRAVTNASAPAAAAAAVAPTSRTRSAPAPAVSAGAAGMPTAPDADAIAAQTTPAIAPEITPTGALPGDASALTPEGEPADAVDPGSAPFIGNIHTMIYHEADADDLPAEENRIYFASEAEARLAGYRRDRDEVLPSEEESATPTGE
jgi:hypothetical protein